MKKLILLLLLVFCTVSTAKDIKALKFTLASDANLFAMTSRFDELLKDRFIETTINAPSKDVLVFIDSPGGSVHSLNAMLDFMKASGKTFTCVARFAASAAFTFFTHCDRRYVMPNGILMAHNASGLFYGEFPKVASRFLIWSKLVENIERSTAKRLKMPYTVFKSFINNEWWLTSREAIKARASDGIAVVSCTKRLLQKKVLMVKNKCTMFGCKRYLDIVSACPILNKSFKGGKNAKGLNKSGVGILDRVTLGGEHE